MDSNNLFENIKILTPDELEAKTTASEEEIDETTEPQPNNEDSSLILADPNTISLAEVDDNKESPAVVNEPTISKEDVDAEARRRERIKKFAKELAEEGIISEFNEEEFDGTKESLKNLMDTTTKKSVEKFKEDFINSFSAEKKRFLQIENAFDQEAMAMRVAQDLEFYNQLDDEKIEEDSDIQKAVYARYLTAKGFTPEEVAEEIEEADSLDKLSEKAKRALPALKLGAEKYVEIQRENRKKQIEESQKREKEEFENLMSDVDSREEIVSGLPYTKHHKEKIKSLMSNVVYEDKRTGKKLNDLGFKQASKPKEFEILLQYYNTLGLFDTDKNGNFKPNLKTLSKYITTKQTGGFEDAFDGDDDISLKASGKGASSKSDNILSFFEKNFK